MGKSSLVEQFQLPHTLVTHFGAPPQSVEPLDYWLDMVRRSHDTAALQGIDICIWDRSFLGNYIYGNFKKDQPALTREEVDEVMKLTVRIFGIVTICFLQCSQGELKKRFKAMKESYITPEEAYKLQGDYNKLLVSLAGDVPVINFFPTNASKHKLYDKLFPLTLP